MTKFLQTVKLCLACVLTGLVFFIEVLIKFILLCIFLIIGIIMILLYPLFKKITFPRWIDAVYDYASDFNELLAYKIWKLWE